MLVKAIADAGVKLGDLERLAVDVGPGRFTGLRVGLATVRALALVLDVEVVGITSLELLAIGSGLGEVAAVIDARRSEVFQQIFAGGTAVNEAKVGDPAELALELDGVFAVGDGADRFAQDYPNRLEHRNPSAADLVLAADGRNSLPGYRVKPLYMREPDVQINIKTRRSS